MFMHTLNYDLSARKNAIDYFPFGNSILISLCVLLLHPFGNAYVDDNVHSGGVVLFFTFKTRQPSWHVSLVLFHLFMIWTAWMARKVLNS